MSLAIAAVRRIGDVEEHERVIQLHKVQPVSNTALESSARRRVTLIVLVLPGKCTASRASIGKLHGVVAITLIFRLRFAVHDPVRIPAGLARFGISNQLIIVRGGRLLLGHWYRLAGEPS